MLEPPWAELDPGIVDAVRVLHDAGIVTTDSGDGSKAATMEGACDFPMVAVDVRSSPALAILRPYGAVLWVNRVLKQAGLAPSSVEWSIGLEGVPIILATWEGL